MTPKELIDVPEEIKTDRLLLRAPRPGLGDAIYESVTASLNELKPWMDWAHEPLSPQGAEIRARRALARFLTRDGFRYDIFLSETGAYIGATGLHRIDWQIRCFDIGYWIDSRHTERGYATEAAKAMADLAFNELGARRVQIRVDSLNLASAAIPPKIGFQLDAVLRNAMPTHDDASTGRDMLMFSLTR